MKKIKIILLILIAGSFNISYGNTDKRPSREIIIKSGDTVIVANLSTNDEKIKTSMRKTYYWYRQGQIFHNVGNYSGILLENSYQVFLENRLILSGGFHKGTKNGTWLFWNNDGTIDNVLYYRKGVLRNKEFKPPKKFKLQIRKKDKEKSREWKIFRRKTKNIDDDTDNH